MVPASTAAGRQDRGGDRWLDGNRFGGARRFAEEGAQAYLTGRRKDVLDRSVEEIGRGAVGVAGDVAEQSALDRLYDRIATDGNRVDVLFANAGVVPLRSISWAVAVRA